MDVCKVETYPRFKVEPQRAEKPHPFEFLGLWKCFSTRRANSGNRRD